MIDLNPHHLETVKRILAEHLPGCEVRAFGSRATWTAKEHSDLDLAVVGSKPLDWERHCLVREAFEESDLPIRVDVVDWESLSESFRQAIDGACVVVQEAAPGSSWRETTLSDVAEIVMGQSPPGSTYNEEGNGLPFFQGVRDFTYRHPTPRVYCSSPSRFAQPGDILLSVRAPIGRVNVADQECATGRGLAIIRCREQSDARFLEFALRHIRHTWEVLEGTGAVFGNATRKDLQDLEIPWPETAERARIARILGALDDKIELNRRMCQTLEAMAQALFKSWFVDFDPVRAKANGQTTNLPPEIDALFPDSLQDSELGEIPGGWEVGRLVDYFDLTMGQSPPGSTYNEDGEGMPFFQGSTDFGFRYPTYRKFCTEPKRIANAGDTLVSVRAPVGDINMASEKCCIGGGLAALRHKAKSSSYTYHAARGLRERLKSFDDNGTVFGAINKGQFGTLPVVEPPAALVSAFDRSFDDKIVAVAGESDAMTRIRDTLLQQLFSDTAR